MDNQENERNCDFLSRVTQIPVVRTVMDTTLDAYQKAKEMNSLVNYTLTNAEKTAMMAAEKAKPLVAKFETQIGFAEVLACKTLDKLEQTVPIIKKTPEEIVGDSKKLYEETFVKPTLARINSVKEYGQEKVDAIKEFGVQKATVFANTKCGQIVTSTVDTLLVKADGYVDSYLPSRFEEGQCADLKIESAVNTIEKVAMLSLKLRQRMYCHGLVQLKVFKKRTDEILANLNITVELITNLRTNFDDKNKALKERMAAARDRLLKMWEDLNPPNAAAGEKIPLEQKLLFVAKQMIAQLHQNYQRISTTLRLLPAQFQPKVQQVQKYISDVSFMFNKAKSWDEVSNVLLNQLQDGMQKLQAVYSQLYDSALQSKALSWMALEMDAGQSNSFYLQPRNPEPKIRPSSTEMSSEDSSCDHCIELLWRHTRESTNFNCPKTESNSQDSFKKSFVLTSVQLFEMQFDYDWQSRMGKLCQRGAHVLQTSWKSDVQFFVGQDPCQQLFPAHKLILAMASPVFEAMLYGEMAEDSTKPINIPDIHPEAFKSLLQYIYTDEIVLQAVDKAVELCYAGKKYILPTLVRQCTQFIWKDMSPCNACRAYEFAKLFDVPFLKDKCINAFKSYTEDILKSSDFVDISEDTLSVILAQQEMTINSEKLVFDAVIAWAKQECGRRNMEPIPSNLREILGDHLYAIRFFAMSTSEFTSGPGVSGIFTDAEMLIILMNISIPGIKPLPSNLSAINPARRHKCKTRYYCALSYPSCPELQIRLAQSPVMTELRLFVDRDISFHGIVFNSQIHQSALNMNNADIVDFRKSSLVTSPSFEEQLSQMTSPDPLLLPDESGYLENLTLQLCSADSEPIIETKFSKKVNWDEKVEVTVEQPYLIKRHTGYVLRVTFGTVGAYRRYTDLMGPSENDGIHITCSYVNGFLVAVHTIIFSRVDAPQVAHRSTSCSNVITTNRDLNCMNSIIPTRANNSP